MSIWPGQPMTEEIHMTKGRRIFRHAMRFPCLHGKLGLAVDNPYYQLTGVDDGRSR